VEERSLKKISKKHREVFIKTLRSMRRVSAIVTMDMDFLMESVREYEWPSVDGDPVYVPAYDEFDPFEVNPFFANVGFNINDSDVTKCIGKPTRTLSLSFIDIVRSDDAETAIFPIELHITEAGRSILRIGKLCFDSADEYQRFEEYDILDEINIYVNRYTSQPLIRLVVAMLREFPAERDTLTDRNIQTALREILMYVCGIGVG
jgi:hypothetical protein